MTQWLVIIITVYTITGFLIVSPIAKHMLAKKLSEQLNREVVIKGMIFNPYALSVFVGGFTVKDLNNSDILFSFEELYLNLQAASVIEKGLILKEVRIYKPYINIIRHEDNLYNFSDLAADGDKEPASNEGPFRFSINNIQILKGDIDFLDSPQNTKHKAKDITLKIPMLSNLPFFINTYIQPYFNASVNGTNVLLSGNSKPFHDSLETIIDLDIKGVDLPHYIEYVPFTMNFKLLSGMIDAKSKLVFIQYKDRPSTITLAGDIALNNLNVVDSDDNPLINLPVYSLNNVALSLSDKKVTIGGISSQNGAIFVRRDKGGTFNLERQLPKLAQELEESAEEKEEAPWIVHINEINYDNYTIKVEDSVPASPVTLTADQINIHAENVSTKKDSRGSLSYSLILNEIGTISAKSSFGINPVAADVTLDVKGVDITTLQPYITEKVNILITGGSFAAGGILSYAASENEEMMISYKGDVSLSKFTTVDKTGANDFLKWNSLYFSGIDFNLDPLNVHISDVSLTDFYSRLIVNPDGSLNVQGIMKEEEVKEESPSSEAVQDAADIKKETGPDKSIKIDTVTLQAGTVNFSDNHIKPNYSANLKEVGGRVSGLSSEEGASADVSLRGKLENHAPLEITGVINPLGEDLYVDLDIDFSDMDLSPLTPYANKFVGYNIQKGQLSLDLKYLIVKKKLDSQNSVLLDQFTLGERVESPDATKLPVKFAISLLKDRKGEINLDIPVTGEIGDPEFSIGGIVIKMIVKLLVKAATSPFALLGALVGGGEELSYIDYEYGSSGLSENEKAKLDKLSKALDDRPALNIEIIGHVDTERDREVMRQAAFDEKLKAQKFKEMVKKGEEVASVNEVDITQEEYELYLTEAYKEEKFPKPKNALGSLKILPPSEIEKLIYTHIKITDDDLRLLASKRALNVKDYFLNSGGIAPNRVFLIEPESLQPKENEKLKSSRVDFKLK
jgi:uncharacterized protein involved in outer membrane biogenesis/acylphosphatase